MPPLTINQSAIARAPATVANVGPGFDVLGFALEAPLVTIEVSIGHGDGIQIASSVDLPTEPMQNTAGAAVIALQAQLGKTDPLRIKIDAGIPIGSGLGSSAASAVAAVVAANALYGNPFSPADLLPAALAGEAVTSGTVHADNVTPAMLGGMTLVRSHQPIDAVVIPVPAGLHYAVVLPACTVNTAESREALPKKVLLEDASYQWAQVGALVAGFFSGNMDLIGRSLEDRIVEPARVESIPHFHAMKAAALDAGALGASIAGSGPAVFALTRDRNSAQEVLLAMQYVLRNAEVEYQGWTGALGAPGAHVV